jgi:hypothetical protein
LRQANEAVQLMRLRRLLLTEIEREKEAAEAPGRPAKITDFAARTFKPYLVALTKMTAEARSTRRRTEPRLRALLDLVHLMRETRLLLSAVEVALAQGSPAGSAQFVAQDVYPLLAEAKRDCQLAADDPYLAARLRAIPQTTLRMRELKVDLATRTYPALTAVEGDGTANYGLSAVEQPRSWPEALTASVAALPQPPLDVDISLAELHSSRNAGELGSWTTALVAHLRLWQSRQPTTETSRTLDASLRQLRSASRVLEMFERYEARRQRDKRAASAKPDPELYDRRDTVTRLLGELATTLETVTASASKERHPAFTDIEPPTEIELPSGDGVATSPPPDGREHLAGIVIAAEYLKSQLALWGRHLRVPGVHRSAQAEPASRRLVTCPVNIPVILDDVMAGAPAQEAGAPLHALATALRDWLVVKNETGVTYRVLALEAAPSEKPLRTLLTELQARAETLMHVEYENCHVINWRHYEDAQEILQNVAALIGNLTALAEVCPEPEGGDRANVWHGERGESSGSAAPSPDTSDDTPIQSSAHPLPRWGQRTMVRHWTRRAPQVITVNLETWYRWRRENGYVVRAQPPDWERWYRPHPNPREGAVSGDPGESGTISPRYVDP